MFFKFFKDDLGVTGTLQIHEFFRVLSKSGLFASNQKIHLFYVFRKNPKR